MIKIELLDKSHDRKRFDCGNTQLNIFLQKTARQHITKGMSRIFVGLDRDNIAGHNLGKVACTQRDDPVIFQIPAFTIR